MSCDFYFRKWKKALADLEESVTLDDNFQTNKTNDKKLCQAAERLAGMLGQYMTIYNEILDCLHQNLQVQKESYMNEVLLAVVARIQEVKHELRKLEASEYQFLSSGLAYHKLTPQDAEITEIPDNVERPESIQKLLSEVFERVKEKKRKLAEELNEQLSEEEIADKWWEADDDNKVEEGQAETEKTIELTEEELQSKNMIELIQAQEKTRQVISEMTQARNKRATWEKELMGTLPAPAPYEIRERAAKIIQNVCRAYFESKRQKILQCKRDEILGLTTCITPKFVNKDKLEQIKSNKIHLKREYEKEWTTKCENIKQEYLKKRGADMTEHYRDHIRDWFKTWYDSILLFNNIPSAKEGGAALIITEELPTPHEWLEKYEAYLAEQKANKNKWGGSKHDAKLEAKREELERRKEEHMKKKFEDDLRKKMMKNPTMHPGYDYPKSTKIDVLLEVIENYHRDWDELDATESLDVKKKYVQDIDISNIYKDVKIELISTVEEDMKNELKKLRKALKTDYENNEEQMPEPMVEHKKKKKKKKQKVKKAASENLSEKLEDLVMDGLLVEYPKTKIEDFVGDPNFTGDDRRCDTVEALPHNGEIRNNWLDTCRESVTESQKILLIGPKGCGKTKLVHVLASLNNAALFEIEAITLREEYMIPVYLDRLVRTVVSCARLIQPAVIYIKDIHKMFYRKVPAEDATVDWKLMQLYFVKKMFKLIQKYDRITVIGTCINPWETRSNQLLKKFPMVVLLPKTSYGTVVQLLKDWMLRNRVIPQNLNISSLAFILQGYNYGYLKNAFERFLTGDTIRRIAAKGLSPMEVYDFILDEKPEGKDDYEKYQKWYSNKTTWGKREQKHLKEQLAFKQACADYAMRIEKKKKKCKPTSSKGSQDTLVLTNFESDL